MRIGIPKETRQGELRVAGTPDFVKKMIKKGFKIIIESDAGVNSGFSDNDFIESGGEIAYVHNIGVSGEFKDFNAGDKVIIIKIGG